jgi:hypothetical protein
LRLCCQPSGFGHLQSHSRTASSRLRAPGARLTVRQYQYPALVQARSEWRSRKTDPWPFFCTAAGKTGILHAGVCLGVVQPQRRLSRSFKNRLLQRNRATAGVDRRTSVSAPCRKRSLVTAARGNCDCCEKCRHLSGMVLRPTILPRDTGRGRLSKPCAGRTIAHRVKTSYIK